MLESYFEKQGHFLLVVSLLHSDTDATYMQSLCSSDFFSSQPSKLVCIISGRYTQCDFCHIFSHHDLLTFIKFCACIDETFLVPNESTWQSLEKPDGLMAWRYSLHKERFICRSVSRFISLIFYQLQLLWTYWVFTGYFVILKILCMSQFGCFQFWGPTHFPEVICLRYDPDLVPVFCTCSLF